MQRRWLPVIRLATTSGSALVIGDTTITPQARSLTLHWSGRGLVWNRPVGVLVQDGSGTRRIPILDVTRLAQVFLLGIGVMIWLVSRAVRTTEETSQ